MKTFGIAGKTGSALAAAALAVSLATPARVQAGDREWATAGKILTGVVVADLLLNHLPATVQRSTYVQETRVYRECAPAPCTVVVEERYVSPAPAVVYCPPPVVVGYVSAPCQRVYVPPVRCAPRGPYVGSVVYRGRPAYEHPHRPSGRAHGSWGPGNHRRMH